MLKMIDVEPLEISFCPALVGEGRIMVEPFQTGGWMNREKVEFE